MSDDGIVNDQVLNLRTMVDVDLERAGILARLSEYIMADKPIPPTLVVFSDDKRVAMVTCRKVDDEKTFDRDLAIVEMLYVRSALRATTSILTYVDDIHFANGVEPAVVFAIFTSVGLVSEAFPIRHHEDGTVFFDNETDLDPETQIVSDDLSDALAIFQRSINPYPPTFNIDWLLSEGHEIELFEGYTANNINISSGF